MYDHKYKVIANKHMHLTQISGVNFSAIIYKTVNKQSQDY